MQVGPDLGTRLTIKEEMDKKKSTISLCVFRKLHGLKKQLVCIVSGKSRRAQFMDKGDICFQTEPCCRVQPADMAVTKVCGWWWWMCPVGLGSQIWKTGDQKNQPKLVQEKEIHLRQRNGRESSLGGEGVQQRWGKDVETPEITLSRKANVIWYREEI